MAERRPKGGGLERVLGTGALFASAYGNVGSSLYYALGLVAGFALGMTPVVFVIAGLIFGLIHLPSGPEAVPSLAVLGVVFCLVYERTGSLYPVIALHAFNNMIAYMVGTEAFALSAALGAAMIAACLLVPRLAWRTAPALP